MGGGIFSGECRRISQAECERETFFLLGELSRAGWRAEVVAYYREKLDFGDIDILVEGDGCLLDFVSRIEGYQKHRVNGECLSFLRNGIQVDLIKVPSGAMDMTRAYFSWNDLGNMMGRLARKMGFRYGHRGLFLEVPDQHGNIVERVRLTDQPSDIFGFMGYDFRRWTEGFDKLEDIFSFAASSKFFSKDCFFIHNLNHGTRMRNKKRKVYAEFLQWLEQTPVSRFDFDSVDWFFWKDRAVGYFGDAWLQEAEAVKKTVRLKEERGRKFNGKIVQEATGLSGPGLGCFLADFRREMDHSLFLFLDSHDENGVRTRVKNAWDEVRGSGGSLGGAVAKKILRLIPESPALLLPYAKSDPKDESE